MDAFASIIILVPILHPVAQQIGMDPIQFGVFILLSFDVGAITPPVGLPLFVTIGIAKCPAEEAFRASFPFVVVLVIGTLLVGFLPELTTFIPSLMAK